MNKRHSTYTIILLLIVFTIGLGSSGGRSDARAGAPGDISTCSGCHSSSGGEGSITLVDPPSQILAGETYSLTLRLMDNNPSFLVGGFQIVATDGVINVQQGEFIDTDEIRITPIDRAVQSSPKVATDGAVEWTFDYVAPLVLDTDNVVFYMAGNAANGNGQNGSGDFGRSSNLTIPFSTQPSAVFDPAESPAQLTVFPNPVALGQPIGVKLDLVRQLEEVSLRIFDLTGREISQQNFGSLIAGERRLDVTAGNLAPGHYLVRVEAAGILVAREMLYVQ